MNCTLKNGSKGKFYVVYLSLKKNDLLGGVLEPDLEKQELMVNMGCFKIISKMVQLLRMTVSGLWPWELMDKAEGKDENTREEEV